MFFLSVNFAKPFSNSSAVSNKSFMYALVLIVLLRQQLRNTVLNNVFEKHCLITLKYAEQLNNVW